MAEFIEAVESDPDKPSGPITLDQLAEVARTVFSGPEPTFVLSRAERGAQRTFLTATYPGCKHEKRVDPYSTRDGEFMFRVPKHCPVCGDVYYYFVTDGKALKPLDNVPTT